MPTFRHGKLTKVFADEFDISNMLNQADVAQTADTAETSAFGTTDKTYVVGLIGSQANLSGMFSGSAGEVDVLFSTWLGDDLDHVVTICQEGNGVGVQGTLMPGKFSGKGVTAGIGSIVGVTATVMSDGKAKTGELLHDFSIVESTTPGSSCPTVGGPTIVDNGVATTAGGAGHLHVTQNSRPTAASTFKVQHSTDNTAWADLVTFTNIGISTVGKERIVLAAGTTVNRYLRGQWALGGASGTATFLIAFSRF